MSGSHYKLSRDLVNPMDVIKEKACTRCGVVKPNTFEKFGKQLWRSRTEHTTRGVCLTCMGSKITEGAAKRRAEKNAYAEYKIQQDIAKFKQGAVEKAAREAAEAAEGSDRVLPETSEAILDLELGRKISDPG